MKRSVITLVLGILTLSLSSTVLAVEADTEGATAGKWTMDLDAAAALAKEKDLPILINFSGSDSCGWCKIMEKNVFSKEGWKEYAKKDIVMVLIDFPKNKKLVPEKFVQRNKDLKDKYGARGFPTFILLDSDAETKLGKLGAGKEKTPASFIAELAKLTMYREASVAKYLKGLKPDVRAKYLAIVNQMPETGKAIRQKQEQIAAAKKAIEELEQKAKDLKTDAQEFRAAQLGEDELKKYESLKSDLETARQKMKDWIATEPERSKENTEKYKAMNATIQEISGKLSKY